MDLNQLDKQQLVEFVGQILGHMKLSVPAPGRAEPGAGLPATGESQGGRRGCVTPQRPVCRSRQPSDSGRRNDGCQSRPRGDSSHRQSRYPSRQRDGNDRRHNRCQSRAWSDSGRLGESPRGRTEGRREEDQSLANRLPGEPRRVRLCFVCRHPNVRNPATCPNASKEPHDGVKLYYYRNR